MDVGQRIINTTETVKKAQQDFQSFTTYNNTFLVVASAICVGIATKDMVTDIMNEAVLPIVTFLTERSISYFVYSRTLEKTAKYPFLNLLLRKLGSLLWVVLVWLLILYVTYIAFKALIKIDLVTDKVELIQGVTRYVTGQEKRHVKGEVQQEHRGNRYLAYVI